MSASNGTQAPPVHPVAGIFPLMQGDDFASLKADIQANGLREPVWTWQGQLIDGRNRLRACRELDIEPSFQEWNGKGSLVAFVVSLNLHRRHLTSSQAAAVAAEIEPLLAKEAKERQREQAKRNRPQADKQKVETLPPIEKAKARDQAAKLTQTNSRYVSDAKAVKEKAPEVFEQVKAGTKTLPQAKVELRRRERSEQLEAKSAAAADSLAGAANPAEIITGDVLAGLKALEAGLVRLAFADPPYNVGVDYGSGPRADRLPRQHYLDWCYQWMAAAYRALTPDGSFWVLINDESAAEFKMGLEAVGFHVRQWLIWYESFGVNHARGFNRTHRHLFWAVKGPGRFVFNETAVLRPSDREAKYGDRRAQPGGKTWDSVWGINPSVPRLTGTCAERLPDFPTQLPLALLLPIVGCASDPGDLVADLFAGSASLGEAALRLGRRFKGFELSEKYADLGRKRLQVVSHELKGVRNGHVAEEGTGTGGLEGGPGSVRGTAGRPVPRDVSQPDGGVDDAAAGKTGPALCPGGAQEMRPAKAVGGSHHRRPGEPAEVRGGVKPAPAIAAGAVTRETSLIDLVPGQDVSAAGRALEAGGLHTVAGLLAARRTIDRVAADGAPYQTTQDVYHALRERAPKLAREAVLAIGDALVDARLTEAVGSEPPLNGACPPTPARAARDVSLPTRSVAVPAAADPFMPATGDTLRVGDRVRKLGIDERREGVVQSLHPGKGRKEATVLVVWDKHPGEKRQGQGHFRAGQLVAVEQPRDGGDLSASAPLPVPPVRVPADQVPDGRECSCGADRTGPSAEAHAPECPAARPHVVGQCRVCGCTQDDCSLCIRRTGHPCTWTSPAQDLCSACEDIWDAPLLER